MRIYLSQLNPIIGDVAGNVQKIIQEIAFAKDSKAELVIFPEMAICGYPPEDLIELDGFIEKVADGLQHIIAQTDDIDVIVGLPRKSENGHDKPHCNSAAIISSGKLLGFQDKALLPTYDVFDERRHFRPAPTEIIWNLRNKRVGVTICEDIWPFCGLPHQELYPSDPLTFFEKEGVDLLINISASPYSLGKIEIRNQAVRAQALRLKCPALLCNQVGAQDGLIFDGSSSLFSKHGELLLQAKSFGEDHFFFRIEELSPLPVLERNDPEELFSALCLGVRDYFKKQGFTKACVGLSGGIDSALVASIAQVALGKDHVLGILMPSRYTSPESTEDALYVAQNLGIDTIEISIEKVFEAYLETLYPFFDGKECDITEENIQARIRGMLLMAVSNKKNMLVLNTGNKSELAVGYTTLYGDACGAISVIGDLLKTQVNQLSAWVRQEFGFIPERVLTKVPTAELRANQKDSDTLPPYDILDKIIEEHVVNGRALDEISAQLTISREVVADIICKIHKNEYKRRQCPFALRVSDKAFSFGRKIPIVQRFIE